MIKIRNAEIRDARSLLDIYAWYVSHTAITFEWTIPSLAEFEDRIRKTCAFYPYLVAEEGNRILGYAYTGPFKERKAYDWSAETSIYVRHGLTHAGIGRCLYEALEKASEAQHIRNLYACIGTCEVPDEYLDSNSIQFHDHLGYRLCGKFENCGFKFGRWYDMVWMEKQIADHPSAPEPVMPYPAVCGK